MIEPPILHELSWPKIKWRLSIIVTVIALLVSAFSFVIPNTETGIQLWRIIVIGLSLSLILFIPLFVWGFQATIIALRRIRNYNELPICMKEKKEMEIAKDAEINKLKKIIYELINIHAYSEFEIIRASYSERNSNYFIELNMSTYDKLKIDDQLLIVDKEDGMVLGKFSISEVRTSTYYAVSMHIDPLWAGELIEKGEISMFPNMKAISVRDKRSIRDE
ncbi:MAG: hypothetical protein ACYC57_02385 [Thermoleophilia bacterium]